MRYRIKELRERQGMTQETLSEKAGIARATLSKLENNDEDQTTTKTLLKLAEALNVTINELFLP